MGGPQRAGYMASPPEGRAAGVGLGERLVTVAVAATAGGATVRDGRCA